MRRTARVECIELTLDKVIQLLAYSETTPTGTSPGLSCDSEAVTPSEAITKPLGAKTDSISLKVLLPTYQVLSPGSLCHKCLLAKHEATLRDPPFMGPQNYMGLVTGGSSDTCENKQCIFGE